MDKFIIGGDPEFFARNTKTKEFVSLIPYIKGTKVRPESIKVKGCFQLKDNVGVEFNMPPVPEYWMLKLIIDECIDYTNEWLKEIDPDLKLEISSIGRFSEKDLDNDEAMQFGCEPAYSVYKNGDVVYRPSPYEIGDLRTASYHIHYGWEEKYSKEQLYKFLVLNDIFLGVPALFLDKDDLIRKKLYGSLSEHRIKTNKNTIYENITEANRVEYRTLGAGIHNFPGFVENGINLVRKHANNLDYFIDLYYDDLVELDNDLTNQEVLNNLVTKLKKNGHWNG